MLVLLNDAVVQSAVGIGLSTQQSVIMTSARATIPKTNKPRNRATAQISNVLIKTPTGNTTALGMPLS
jgi:hypothetical protein